MILSKLTRVPWDVVAVAAILLHLADDNFFQPEAGDWSDHLVSGSVPVAALGGLWWAACRDRGRPGVRALCTAVLGLAGLTVGTESLHHLAVAGLRGDDWSGLLAVLAGLGLLGSAIVAGWLSRRREGSRARRVLRWSAKTLAGGLLAVQIVYPVVESYVATNTSDRAAPLDRLGVDHETVELTTADGVRLDGWYVPSRNRAAILVFPGRTGAQRQARMLIAHGYGVLLVDRRATGTSDGEANGYGWGSDADVHAAIEFLQRRPDVDVDRIGGIGLSVGGELLLEAAAEGAGLRAIVSDGAGVRSTREFFEFDGAGKYLIAPLQIAATTATAVFSNQLPPPGLVDLVPSIDAPLFFIYATNGQGGEELSERYHDVASAPTRIWAHGHGHVGGIEGDPAEYERRVIDFLDDSFAL